MTRLFILAMSPSFERSGISPAVIVGICGILWCSIQGHAIAEAVSLRPSTPAGRVRSRFWQVGFVVDKVASVQVLSEYFGFSCQKNSSFHQLHHHNHPGQLAEALRRADHASKESCRLS
jgi:hypothetical protein